MNILTLVTKAPALRRNHGMNAVAAAGVAILLALFLVWTIMQMAQESKPYAPPTVASMVPVGAAAQRPAAVTIPLDENTVAARINGDIITYDEVRRTAAIDAAVAQFLGQPTEPALATQLDLLLNGLLVTQQANAAGFGLSPATSQQALASWLATAQQSESTLQTTIAAAGISYAEFETRFTELLLVDRFLDKAAAQSGVDRATLLRHWQQAAQISYGPAANSLATTTSAAPQPTVAAPASLIPATPPTPARAKIGPFTLWQDGPATQALPTIATVVTTADSERTGQAALNTTTGNSRSTTTTVTSTTATTVAVLTTTAALSLPPIGLAPGNRAPAFTLSLLSDGRAVNLEAWQGKPIVLSFWTTWCPYCRKQTPMLVAAANEAAATDIQFLGVNVNETDTPVAAYVTEQQIPYPILLDSDSAVARQYNVRGYPTTYFIDAAGQIVAKHVGTLDESHLADYLARLRSTVNE
jgi:peroxiredoxin